MSVTNFAALQDYDKFAWASETWMQTRERSFIMQRVGTGPDSAIQRITELTALPSGNKAIINLLHDLTEDGVVGDNTLEGREEAAKMSQIEIVVDQLRHGIANKGRMADQKAVLKIRNEAKDLLSFHLADRLDQLAFLTMAGVPYSVQTNGAPRPSTEWTQLEFASYVTPPSANRHFRWDGTNNVLAAGNTAAVAAGDKLTMRALIELKAAAHDLFIRPLRINGGVEYYEVYVHPQAFKSLRLDPEFVSALQNAMPRTPDNPIFKGAEVYYVDGLAIYPYRHSYNTRGLPSGSKWGATGTVDGNRVTLMGAQGLAYAELGAPDWEEQWKDYKNRWGIALGQIIGFLKPQFPDMRLGGSKEDFAMLSLDVAL